MRNARTVDVEDWFQAGAFEAVIAHDSCSAMECRVERDTDAVLQLYDDARLTPDFFTLGCLAERYPGLTWRITDAGHDIATNRDPYYPAFTPTPNQIADDRWKTRTIWADASGQAATGYRVPIALWKNWPVAITHWFGLWIAKGLG